MKIESNITHVEKTAGGGWKGISKDIPKREPWHGLTPKEAYYKGIED